MRFLAGSILGAAVLAGCATAPVSFVEGKRWLKAELNTFDVLIISVDGKHYLNAPGDAILIDPGVRRIVVQAPPAGGMHLGEQRTLTLDVKPCTRYYLEAKKANALAQDFEPRVNYSEPVGGCGPR